MVSYSQFRLQFDNIQKNESVLIRYTKNRDKQVIHKDIKIKCVSKKLFVKETEGTRKKSQITKNSLKGKHAYLATLFSALEQPPEPAISNWKKFKTSDDKIKWLTRYFLLNTWVIGGVVGRIIAYSANKGNPHYRTFPSRVLAKTLGPLIFPGGSKKPTLIKDEGVILLDSVVHKQYKAMKNYSPKYRNEAGEKIRFKKKQVTMQLRNKQIRLKTIAASNCLVKKGNKEHLHIIYFNGNSSSFQQDYRLVAEDLLHYARDEIPATAVQFNYPGVLNSQGHVKAKELIDAGIAQVQALLDAGVPHDKIVLHGISLGGSIASYVGAHFHKQKMIDDPEQKQTLGGLYVTRTFASTTQVGRDFFNRALGDNVFSRVISTASLPFIKLGTWGAEWNLDTGKAFFSLPKDRRYYAVVISSKADRKAYGKQLERSGWKKFCDFILRRKHNPVDDAILRRGLHDSWEKRKESFWIKRGFHGKEAKKAYVKENRSRKMVVFDFKNAQPEPNVDGHVKARYCYKNSQEEDTWYTPGKNSKAIGLQHRSENPCEAGEFARQHILKMASISD